MDCADLACAAEPAPGGGGGGAAAPAPAQGQRAAAAEWAAPADLAEPAGLAAPPGLAAPAGPGGSAEAARRLEVAAVWVEKARRGCTSWVDEAPPRQLWAHRFRVRLRPWARAAKSVLLLLALFETPSWCLADVASCRHPAMAAGPLPVLPVWLSSAVEMACLAFFAARLPLRRLAHGAVHAVGPWQYFGAAMIWLALLDCVVSIFNRDGLVRGTFRLSRLCRPLVVLAITKRLREAAGRVGCSIPKVLDALAALALCVAAFVWLGMVLFAGTSEGSARFDTWGEAFASMWVLFTTANCPDVFVAALNQNRGAFLFFAVYLVSSLFLLNNVLLAAVYNAYRDQLRASVKAMHMNRREALGRAFALLAGPGGERIDAAAWAGFFAVYASCGRPDRSRARLERSRSFAVLRLLEIDPSDGLCCGDFRLCMDALLDGAVCFPRPSAPLHRHRWARKMRRVALEGVPFAGVVVTWDAVVDVVIFLEALVIAAETSFVLSLHGGGEFDEHRLAPGSAWFAIGFVVAALFALEVSAKVAVLGASLYWYRKALQHRFDVFAVSSRAALEIAFLFPAVPAALGMRTLLLWRLIRAWRLMRYVRPFHQLWTVLTRLAPAYWQMGYLLFLVFYVYATFGEQVFGGLIYTTNPHLEGSDYQKGQYWALTFNDFASGIMTLFVLTVVNNWYVIADAFHRVTGTAWSYCFFVSFFVVTNLIVLNILVALILECCATLQEDGEPCPTGRAPPLEPGLADDGPLAAPPGAAPAALPARHYNARATLTRLLLADDLELAEDFAALPSLSSPRSTPPLSPARRPGSPAGRPGSPARRPVSPAGRPGPPGHQPPLELPRHPWRQLAQPLSGAGATPLPPETASA